VNFTNTGNLGLLNGGPSNLTLSGSNSGDNTLAQTLGGALGVTKNGSGTWVLTGNNTYTGNTTITAGTLVMTNLWLPPSDIFVLGTGTFEYQPDGNDSLTVSAVADAGSAYPWGDTTYEVDVQGDGSWVLPALNMQITAVTGGYELAPWTAPVEMAAAWMNTLGNDHARQAAVKALVANWLREDPQSLRDYVANLGDSTMRDQINAWIDSLTNGPAR
jgi:autotransporter-associated beta strand protein